MAQLFNFPNVEPIMTTNTYTDSFDSPLGTMEITATEEAILGIHFVDVVAAQRTNRLTDLAKKQMLEYYAGDRKHFDLPLQAAGTEFQKNVWQALTTIDYAKTCSYGYIANLIRNPKAVRAVGAANGKNPMTIVVPCHRIIGADGSLTGYGSGVERKAWLLQHEAKYS